MESTLFNITRDHGTIYLDPKAKHEQTLIFLHGLGDSSEGFFDVFAEQPMVPATCRVVLPTAPKKAVSCNNGYKMNSWFDIYNLSGTPNSLSEIRKEYNQDELKESVKFLIELIRTETSKFSDKDSGRVFIGGFS